MLICMNSVCACPTADLKEMWGWNYIFHLVIDTTDVQRNEVY